MAQRAQRASSRRVKLHLYFIGKPRDAHANSMAEDFIERILVRGLAPRWEQHRFSPDERQGTLLPVVTPAGTGATHAHASKLQIDQDATFFVASLAPGQTVSHASEAGRRAYVFAVSGALDVNDVALEAGDQARITGGPTLTLTARAASELILIDLP